MTTEPHVYAQESTIQPYIGSFAKKHKLGLEMQNASAIDEMEPHVQGQTWSNCKMRCIGEWLCDLWMPFFERALKVEVHGGNMNEIQNQINHYYGAGAQDLYRIPLPVGDASYTRPGPVARCYPGTRLEVIAKIEKWMKDGSDRPILWLNGPAGSGKSAISQTIAELYKDRICASFFFLRGAGQRSQIQLLIPTLVHQFALSMPKTKEIIEDVLKNEPHIYQQALQYQLERLLINLVRAERKGLFKQKKGLIIIDALDECDDKEKMGEFIEAITILCNTPRFQLPFRLLLTSRVEEHIQQQFNDPKTQSVIHYLPLEDFDATEDIQLYLKSRLSTIYKRNCGIMHGISQSWPSTHQLKQLSRNAEGSFIVAFTLVNFIEVEKGHPKDKLEMALNMTDGLDPTYHDVITKALQENEILQDRHPDIFHEVLAVLALAKTPLPITAMSIMLQIEAYYIAQILLGLQAILLIPGNDDEPVKLFHTSLRDYLYCFVSQSVVYWSMELDGSTNIEILNDIMISRSPWLLEVGGILNLSTLISDILIQCQVRELLTEWTIKQKSSFIVQNKAMDMANFQKDQSYANEVDEYNDINA
ncbi:hypothetical protein BDQ12DRAFT_667704 [Crucibulum laeve]|uniref:NACHT domain-containing protein n=1 Tax=Crucibulum laeve TaxID=68775 RepID=A0A5C3LUQ8_9AGAR|nr:hypothetical protein BDQ12DRAFT_667704 [Crucibulum laeve]